MLEEREYEMLRDIRHKNLTKKDKCVIDEIAKNHKLNLKEMINVVWNKLFNNI